MIYGAYNIPRVVEESVCRSSKDYRFTELGLYKIHSTSLMPNIPFGEASEGPYIIEPSIFINDPETKLNFVRLIQCQNYLTTRYIGRAPLEWYGPGQMTNKGRKFMLVCRNGNPNAEYRVFGTEEAIRGYNKNATDLSKYPGGGDS